MNIGFHRVRVWDLPTRLFHWALMLCVLGAVGTGLVGGTAMIWHFRLGQAVLALLAFRLVWGLVGGRWSRFASLPLSPRSLLAYLRGRAGVSLRTGHSPLGALAVLGFLLVLATQVATGLVSDDEIAWLGPLSHLVSNATVSAATSYHRFWGKWLILSLVLLHLLAITWYSLKGHKLVPAMVHGDKTLDEPMLASRDDRASRLVAALLFGLSVALSVWVFSLAPAGF